MTDDKQPSRPHKVDEINPNSHTAYERHDQLITSGHTPTQHQETEDVAVESNHHITHGQSNTFGQSERFASLPFEHHTPPTDPVTPKNYTTPNTPITYPPTSDSLLFDTDTPPTDPGTPISYTPPTDPGTPISYTPPTDPGTPPTDPGSPISHTPPTDPGTIIIHTSTDHNQLVHRDLSGSHEQVEVIPPPTIPSGNYEADVHYGPNLVPPTEPNLLFKEQSNDQISNQPASIPHTQELPPIWSRDTFVTLSQFLSAKWGTFSLVISILVIYYMTTYATNNVMVTLAEAISWGANFAPKTNGQSQEWWRLLTAPYLHWDSAHLVYNLGALILLSLHIEHLIGTLAILGLFCTSATLAGMATLIAYPAQVSMGASGGIYGIFGAIITLFILTRGKQVTNAKLTTSAMIIWLVYSLATNINSPWVDNASHFGGMLSGFILGVFYAPLYKRTRLSIFERLTYNLLPIVFTIITITLSWSLLPTPHPIFELLEQYSRQADKLRQYSNQFPTLNPLNQRAVWETDIKPILINLEHKFTESAEGKVISERNEIKDVTQATQWALKRLLNGWWIYFGKQFESPPSDLSIEHDAGIPFHIAHSLYESLFAQQAISQLIDPVWDERTTALKTYDHWSHLENARYLISNICRHLVGEASSPKVRELGSLWGQPDVRESRFKLVEQVLQQMPSLLSIDLVTLNQISWLRGNVDEVKESISNILSRQVNDQPSLSENDQVSLTQLLYRAFLSSPETQLDPSLQFKLDSNHNLKVLSGNLPKQGKLYLLAQQCVTKQTKSDPHIPDPISRFLVEIRVPKLLQIQKLSIIKHVSDLTLLPICLNQFKAVGWLSFNTDPSTLLNWTVYPLDTQSPVSKELP